MTEQRIVPTRQLTEVADCLEAMATGKGGWAWAVSGGWQWINRTPTPDQRELMLRADDFTVDELWIMLLAAAPQPPATAQPSAVACHEEDYWADQRLAAYATDKEK